MRDLGACLSVPREPHTLTPSRAGMNIRERVLCDYWSARKSINLPVDKSGDMGKR